MQVRLPSMTGRPFMMGPLPIAPTAITITIRMRARLMAITDHSGSITASSLASVHGPVVGEGMAGEAMVATGEEDITVAAATMAEAVTAAVGSALPTTDTAETTPMVIAEGMAADMLMVTAAATPMVAEEDMEADTRMAVADSRTAEATPAALTHAALEADSMAEGLTAVDSDIAAVVHPMVVADFTAAGATGADK